MGLAYKFPKFYELMDRLFFEGDENSPLSALGVEMMDVQSLSKNAVVVDLACGSGTVALWIAEQRPDIHVIGLDLAEDMVMEAESTAKELDLQNTSFICQSALTVTSEDLLSVTSTSSVRSRPAQDIGSEEQKRQIEMIVCSYGFSAMGHHHKDIFEKTVELLAPNGRYVIMDLNYPTRNWLSLFMTYGVDSWLWGSNQLNRVWEVMPKRLTNFEKREQPLKLYGFLPAVFFVAKGIKT